MDLKRERERESPWVAKSELWGLNRWNGAFNVVAEPQRFW
jgi:hypothetical protein